MTPEDATWEPATILQQFPQGAISIAISYIISVYCEDYAGFFTVILPFLAFYFCSTYFIYLVSCNCNVWKVFIP
jgi:hypothetical protein